MFGETVGARLDLAPDTPPLMLLRKLTRDHGAADRLIDLHGVERAMLDQRGCQRIDDI